jgi:hypothetical protein
MNDERIITLDLHTHLVEKKVKAADYWRRVAEVKLDAVAICEHSELSAEKAYRVLEKGKKGSALLIPGIEVNTGKGHILAYSADAGIYGIQELQETPVDIGVLLDSAKDNNLLLSIAHPRGFDYDSLGYSIGAEELEEFVLREFIGVEMYNGMMGYLSNFIYDSGWIKRPVNFLDFLEKNRVAGKTGINRLGRKLKSSIDRKRWEVVARNSGAVELGSIAKFVTAGSDAHSADRIGSGIMKIRTGLQEPDAGDMLEEILKKDNVIWSGPPVREVGEGMYERVIEPLTKKEIMQGLKYITTRIISKKVRKRRSEEGSNASDEPEA